jgi:hypothetical protein
MANDACCYAAGGRVTVTANGRRWSPRATVNIMPTNFERAVESNQDGTIFTTTKPQPFKATMSLSDSCGMKIEDIMSCPIDVTIELVDVRRTYFFTKAVVVGRPEINTENGEIRNLEITSNLMRYENF